MTAQPIPLCRYLDWDSQFFNRRIARLTSTSLNSQDVDTALAWCRSKRIDCLYYLAPAEDFTSIHLAEQAGFHLVDIRMTFTLPENHRTTAPEHPQIRLVRPEDLPALKEIARQAYRSTRFFNDPHFPHPTCEQLYMVWIENSCQGYAQAVWVADAGNGPIGYTTCHLDGKRGQIGLVGIHPDHHQRGWGRKLVSTALQYFSEQHCHPVQVVTQGNNLSAQKLYAACGFTIRSVECWYHRWFDPSPLGSLNERISDTI